MLVECGECGATVSERAAACPQCGNPLAGVVTTERTAKGWKLLQLVGGVGSVVAVVMLLVGMGMPDGAESSVGTIGALSLPLLLGAFVMGRLGAWWHHG